MEAGGDSLAEALERVIQAQGRLLRVERAPLAGPAGAQASSALRLTFDVGVVTVRPGGDPKGLEVETGPGADPGAAAFLPASEDEPWWKVIGCPLTRVEARGAGCVRARFRGDRDNPRWFALLPLDGGIGVSMDS